MKKVLLSLSFVFFSFFSTSQVFASAFDCSFSEQQLKTMTRGQFLGFDAKAKTELALLFIASSSDDAAGKLIDLLKDATLIEIQGYANNVPPTIFKSFGIQQRSVRGMVLETTVKAIGMGFVKEVPVQVMKQLLGIPV